MSCFMHLDGSLLFRYAIMVLDCTRHLRVTSRQSLTFFGWSNVCKRTCMLVGIGSLSKH